MKTLIAILCSFVLCVPALAYNYNYGYTNFGNSYTQQPCYSPNISGTIIGPCGNGSFSPGYETSFTMPLGGGMSTTTYSGNYNGTATTIPLGGGMYTTNYTSW
jgi:hypothetical protein